MVSVKSTMLPLGTPAPAFALPDPTGGVVSSDEAAGACGTLVVFACNHCPYVKHIASVLAGRADEWISAGIGVVAINSNDAAAYPRDAPAEMARQAQAWNWRFPYLVDADQSVAKAFHAACTPDFYLFDAQRLLVYRGRFDAATPKNDVPVTGDELDAAVAALLAGGPIADEQAASIGCNIKWQSGNEPGWFGPSIVQLKS